jgi:hypothetical protein
MGRLLSLACLLGPAFPLAADEVLLLNGDRLSGRVVGFERSKLRVETSHSGLLSVEWKEVRSLRTDRAVRVMLDGGERVEGRLVSCPEGRVHIVDPQGRGPEIEMDKERIAHLGPLPAEWHGLVNLSARASDGNADAASFLASAEATRATAGGLALLRGVARYRDLSGELQERNGYGLAKYQVYLHPEAYVHGGVEATSDRFKDLRAGVVGTLGTGYDLVRTGWTELSAEAGLSYFENRFYQAEDEGHVGARLGGRLRVALPLGVEARDLFASYPNFEDAGDWQIRNEATLGTSLGGGWSLLGGVISEIDHEPADDRPSADDTYFLGLGLKF